jgi:geranylgeranyl reductase family protein
MDDYIFTYRKLQVSFIYYTRNFMTTYTDVIIAGGGFAGLACAKALAEAGVGVILLERKAEAGVGMHTTGIIVGECAQEFAIPEHLTRKITDVRLFAPNLRYIDLKASDYFFLATDTPALMQHLSNEAQRAGATILYDTPYQSATQLNGIIEVNSSAHSVNFSSRFLIGADGARSKVAKDFSLGINSEFLLGVEAEYTGLELEKNSFYCFLNQKLANGYLGWVVPSVGVTQVGVATRMPQKPDIEKFAEYAGQALDFTQGKIISRRGGLIPVGGLVSPFARGNVILLGDSAGIVSPLTAGGIHTALHYGKILGEAIAKNLKYGGEHPATVMAKIYPRFYLKQGLRKVYEHLAPDFMLNLILNNPLFKTAASVVFFKEKRLK